MSSLRWSGTLALLAGAALLASASTADGYTWAEDEKTTLTFRAAGQASVRSTAAERTDPYTQFDFDFVRIAGAGEHDGVGSFDVQLGAKSGTPKLLDARASLEVLDPVSFQVGRFKTPVSYETSIGAPDLLSTRRAALSGVVLRRSAGGQVVGRPVDGESFGLELAAGLFSPGALSDPSNSASVGVGRAKVRLGEHVIAHGAFAAQITPTDSDADRAEAPLENDRQLDLAVAWDDATWRAMLEGVVAFDGPGRDQPVGLYAEGARAFEVGEYEVEPGLAYDYLDRGRRQFHRGRAVFNTYWFGTKMMTSAEYALELRDGPSVDHVATLSMQAAF